VEGNGARVAVLKVMVAVRRGWPPTARAWALLVLPCLLIVALQESGTPFRDGGLVIFSALCQHAAAGLLLVPLALLRRRSGGTLPLWACLAAWSADALCRGLIGGLIAAVLNHSSPNFGYRILLWLVIAWVWIPLISYLVAQRNHRSLLLRELARAREQREMARRRAERPVDDVQAQLVNSLSRTVQPVIEETSASLAAAHSLSDVDQLRLIGARLTEAAVATGHATGQLPDRAGPDSQRVTVGTREVDPPHRKGPGPVLWLTLTVIGYLVLTTPGLSATDGFVIAPELLLPLCAGLAGTVVSVASGVAGLNRELVRTVSAVVANERTLDRMATTRENELRYQLERVVHGPILGRLSACAMAVNFHVAQESAATCPRAFTLCGAVLEHLDAIRDDLTTLTDTERQG
jgi:hypothetical protein